MAVSSRTLWPALHDMQYADVLHVDCVHIVMEGTDVEQHADTLASDRVVKLGHMRPWIIAPTHTCTLSLLSKR